jgi:hypothetical protein
MLDPAISKTEAGVVGALSRAGAWAAIAAAILTVAWLATMAISPPPGAGTAESHLRDLRANEFLGSLPYAVVLAFGMLLLPVWIALAARTWRAHPIAASLTLAFGLLYAPFTTAAYWSQLTVARGIADVYPTDPVAAVAAYQLFDFGATTSFTFALDVGGYAILGLGSMAAAILLWSDWRIGRVAATTLALSGALSMVGAAGLVLRASPLQVGAIASGLPFLVAIVAVAVLLRRPSVMGAGSD